MILILGVACILALAVALAVALGGEGVNHNTAYGICFVLAMIAFVALLKFAP